MLISLAAIAPRVYVYTRIGREIFNPFSRTFVILIMIFVAFGGVGFFIVNLVFYIKRKNDRASGKDAFEEEQVSEEKTNAESKERYIPILPEDAEALDGAEYEDISELRNKFNGR